MKRIKDSRIFAFWQGFIERFSTFDGRTHPTDQTWNEAYDQGMNLAERVMGAS